MIRINLLPYRAERKKENIKRQILLFFFTLIVVIFAIWQINSYLNEEIDDLNAEIAVTTTEIAKYKKITKEITKIKKDLEILNKKIEVIKNLERYRKEPVRLLEAMTRLVIAKRMWFTSFSATGDNIQTVGVALDNKTVVDFMTRLESSKLFSSVDLKTLRKQSMQNLNLKSFQISLKKAPFEAAAGSKK